MSKITVLLGQKDHRHFNLGQIKTVTIPPQTEEITVKSKEVVQEIYPTENKYFSKVTVDPVALDKPDQTKTTIPTKERQVIKADAGYELYENIVEPIPDNYEDVTEEVQAQNAIVANIQDIMQGMDKEVYYTADATATPNDIISGKTAYVEGGKITGEFEPLDISDTTATAETVIQGNIFYDANGIRTEGTAELKEDLDTELAAQETSITNLESAVNKLPEPKPDMLQARVDATNSCSYLFYNYKGNNVDYITNLDTSNVTSMQYMFGKCENIQTIPSLNTTNVADMKYMFYSCKNLLSIPQLDISNASEINALFYGCERLNEIPKLTIKEGVTNFSYMFKDCKSLKTLDVSTFNTSQASNMSYMFNYCYQLTELDVSNFDTSNVTNMQYMFGGLRDLTELDVSNFDTSKVISADRMFDGTYYGIGATGGSVSHSKLQKIIVGDNFMSKVATCGYMFYYLNRLTDIEGVINMQNMNAASNMFANCTKLTNLTIKNIKCNLQIGSGTSYGHLLTDASLINTAKELWDMTGSSSKTLTVSTPSNARFDAIYVRLVDVTDDMVAEDEYISNKKPCVVCESTDTGAMTLREYVISKNWALA